MRLKLEISKEKKHFIYALLKAVLMRIIAIALTMLAGWGWLAIGLIDELWGTYFYVTILLNTFIFGREYEKHCL